MIVPNSSFGNTRGHSARSIIAFAGLIIQQCHV